MQRYLGETKNPEQYRQLLREKLEENGTNEIDVFEIETKQGKFKAFPAKLEGQEGYIYSVDRFDVYEFSTEEELLNVKLNETVKIASSIKLNIQEAQDAILAERNNKTKEVEVNEIEFYNHKGWKERKVAKKAKLNGEEGFVYQEQQWNNLRERNVNVNYFVKAKDLYSKKPTQKLEMLTQKELKEKEKQKLKEEYELTKTIFKERNIEINNYPDFETYESIGRYRIGTIVNKLKSLEKVYGLKIENKKVDFNQLDKDLTEMLTTKKIEEANKDMLKSYGFTIKAEIEDNDLTITLLGKNNKKLSQLKTNDFIYEEDYESIKTDEWGDEIHRETVEVNYGFIDLENQMDSDDKALSIIENNKIKAVHNSKYASLYEIFNQIAFTNDENLTEESDFENELGVNLEIQDVNLENQLELINFVKKEIENNPELKQELEAINKQTNKRTQKI